jgi:hypothetical protein
VLGNIEYVIHTAGGNLNIDNDLLGKLVEGAARARHLESNIQFFRDNFIEDLRDADRAVWGAARALPDDRKKIFVSLGLLIDFASNLADKVKFNPIVVAPAEPLTGDPLYGFSGFFLNEIRTSDFIRGMKDTYETWKRVREVSDPDFKIDPSPQFPADPLPPDWKNIPAFRDRYDKAQHEFESRIGAVVGGAIAGPIFGRLVAIPVQFLASQFLR